MRRCVTLLLLTLAAAHEPSSSLAPTSTSTFTFTSTSEQDAASLHGITPAKWSFAYVKPHLVLTLFLLCVAVSKIVYYNTHILSSWIPESCILIILGASVGYLILATACSLEQTATAANGTNTNRTCSHSGALSMTPAFFFLVLVPPIVLESAYNLHDRTFMENLGGVMCFAVVGTVANFLLIGFFLNLCASLGAFLQPQLNLRQALLFSSFIVAVDPIAVLSIFEEIGVDRTLYFLVFGESLLNDAVTVVLYNVMSAFSRIAHVEFSQIALAIVSFFTVSVGGLVIGVLVGAFSSVLLKYTQHVRVVEPLLVFVTAYLSYLLAELFDWSGIISIIFCGLMQAQYAFHNISHKSYTTVKYFSKTLASVSEAMIFLLLGMELVANYKHVWNAPFIAVAICVCVIVRFIVVMAVSLITNCWNSLRKISLTEQFIIAYGGLRGAVAFSLAASLELSSSDAAQKHTFITTTLSIIIFTVFFQGVTIKPLVKLLRIRVEGRKQLSLVCEITSHVQDHICAGIEEIIGTRGSFYIKEYLSYADGKYLKPLLQREPQTRDQKIMQIYQKIALRMHFATINTSSRSPREDRLSPGLMRSISNRSIPTLIEQPARKQQLDVLVQPPHEHAVQIAEVEVDTADTVSPDKVMRVMRMNSIKRNRRSYKHRMDGPHAEYLRQLEEKSIVMSKLAKMRQCDSGTQHDGSTLTLSPACTNKRLMAGNVYSALPVPPAISRQDSIMSLLFNNQEDLLLDVGQACFAASVLCAPVLSVGAISDSLAAAKKPRTMWKHVEDADAEAEAETCASCNAAVEVDVEEVQVDRPLHFNLNLNCLPTITVEQPQPDPDTRPKHKQPTPRSTAV